MQCENITILKSVRIDNEEVRAMEASKAAPGKNLLGNYHKKTQVIVKDVGTSIFTIIT